MFVGETIIKLFPIYDKTLIFDYDEDDPMLHNIRTIVLEPLENGDIPEALKPPSLQPTEEPKTDTLHKRTILDSDDDDEDNDEVKIVHNTIYYIILGLFIRT